jgi:hypothetical protein
LCISDRVSHEEYRRALDAAIAEYEALGEQRRETDKRLGELAQSIGTLMRLLGLTPTVPLGLTDACRLVLRAGVPLTATDVRDRLLHIGFDLSIYSSDLAVIHTVLKRLNEAGEIRLLPRAGGRHAYLYARPPRAIAIGPEVAEYVRGHPRFHTDPRARGAGGAGGAGGTGEAGEGRKGGRAGKGRKGAPKKHDH